ncbi:MAG: hypothetical protein A3D74_03690 [Candidatus Levybacteria bacterium RIFCSPHIGHO2_02_FULL_37_13]|nr:MAG: hypothetical protein A3D74_03690 [Candidatus Levybacteria bacterium RIFCSPHIGHO2_02_FULL_37_13]OGH38224.1 MAG: hypothetical protein A3B41_00020 [Candidatus Levybacteria bacterium RIFCSPLOWO2_01_FULL_37_26]
MNERGSFLGILVEKLSFAREVEDRKGVSTNALEKDVLRQISQVSKAQNGNIISGEGVTKSGIEG